MRPQMPYTNHIKPTTLKQIAVSLRININNLTRTIMPTNKDALSRIKILDDLLSNKYHQLTWDELVEAVNDRLAEKDLRPVTRRCIEKDIDYIEDAFETDIVKNWVPAETQSGQSVSKKCLKYADPDFSIFKKKMTREESYLLKQIISTLGQFDGLPNFSEIASLANSQLAKSIEKEFGDRKIIAFDKNPSNKERVDTVFAKLYLAISQKQVVKLHYHTYKDLTDIKTIVCHPYFLKEYNRRWFVFGIADEDKFELNFALDRIDDVESLPANNYIEYGGQFDEWFDSIIGVTRFKDESVEKILFWASDSQMHYIDTKALHDTQVRIKKDDELRKAYPELKGGWFFRIECMKNYELIRELCSYSGEVIVLKPSSIRDAVIERIKSLANAYSIISDSSD